MYITAQNHGYAVEPESLPPELEVSHVSLNDGTVEGLRHRSEPIMSIQYHSEASPGPLDNEYIFTQFLDMVDGASWSRQSSRRSCRSSSIVTVSGERLKRIAIRRTAQT